MNVFNSWQFFAFASAFFAALTAIFGKIGVADINSNFATFIRTIVILFVIAFILTIRSEWERPELIAPKTYLFLALSAVATGGSWLCYYRALQIGSASRVAPIDKLSVVLVMVLAVVFLREKLNLVEVIGGFLVTVGAVIIALA